jgi:hypothetical protein
VSLFLEFGAKKLLCMLESRLFTAVAVGVSRLLSGFVVPLNPGSDFCSSAMAAIAPRASALNLPELSRLSDLS